MKNAKKFLALILAVVMCVGLLASCSGGNQGQQPGNEQPGGEQPGGDAPAVDNRPTTPLVVGYAPFNEKFSPFFSETAYDQDVWGMTALGLLVNDRTGAIVMKGIEGETIPYNGTDYTYYGPADCVITENADGTVYYDFTMREDLVFSDGEPVTIDDVIFSMYVLCDPTYDGNSSLYAVPIEGMAAYRSGMDTLFNLLVAAGPDNTDFTYWDEATQSAFWADINQAGVKFAQSIVDYVYANYGEAYSLPDPANGGEDFAANAAMWGFGGNNAEEMWAEMYDAYEGDIATCSSTEAADVGIFDLMNDYAAYTKGVTTGESAPNISGIQKTGPYSMRVVTTEVDATAIYQLGVTIAPMHYYGDKSMYNYDANQFGFPKGDLSMVRSKTTVPMGAGAYKFLKYENNTVYFEANDLFFKGAPKIKYINFLVAQEAEKLNGVITGSLDVTDPSFNQSVVDAIMKENNGGITGSKITTSLVNNLGYGYIGMSAAAFNVGGDPASDASKNLRRAFATVLSVYRDVAIDSYYGERASVINYPISNTSWAAPQPSDDGYQLAFSTDVNGNPIYNAGMSAEEKYAAAMQAALGFLEAAGYTVENGKVTAAPAGAALEYEFWIPADGIGDHPSFMICTLAHDAFAEVGINLIIRDLSDSSQLWTSIEARQVPMWCAAWGATIDPDMTQIYFSDIANFQGDPGEGKNPFGGKEQGGSNYMYCIADPELDKLIKDARASTDQAYRKAMYKACLDKVIDWAVEVPVYQRQNAIIFSTERVNMATMTPDITTFYGWMGDIENIELN